MRDSSRAAVSPAATDSTDASQTAGRMSKGVRHPAAERTEAMVAGMSWMDAVFSTDDLEAIAKTLAKASEFVRKRLIRR